MWKRSTSNVCYGSTVLVKGDNRAGRLAGKAAATCSLRLERSEVWGTSDTTCGTDTTPRTSDHVEHQWRTEAQKSCGRRSVSSHKISGKGMGENMRSTATPNEIGKAVKTDNTNISSAGNYITDFLLLLLLFYIWYTLVTLSFKFHDPWSLAPKRGRGCLMS